MANKLTVLIPCRNERHNIAHCIDAVRDIADELLVADSGSTDGTLEYVRARGDCRLIERAYNTAGDFKNWAISHAAHEWVLIVEADERVTPALSREIRRVLDGSPAADGFIVSRTNHLLGHPVRHTDWGRDRVLRLGRRLQLRYIGPGDHQIAVVASGKTAAFRHPLLHYTMWSWGQYLQKFERYTRVQAEEWHALGKRPSYLKMFVQPPLRFLRDYVLHRGFLDGAAGLQLAWMSAFYSFMKQARLWELHHGLTQRQVEAKGLAPGHGNAPTCDPSDETRAAAASASSRRRFGAPRRAAAMP